MNEYCIVLYCANFGSIIRFSPLCTIRYDTIRYSRLTCAQKLTDGQLNLAHGPESKKRKNKIKKRVAQKKRSRQRSVEAEAVLEEEVKLRG